jgi:flagellin-like protein
LHNKGISPIIAVLLVVAIALVASLIVYAWVMGYIGGITTKENTQVEITPTIYSSSNNIGILNEEASFGINATNNLDASNDLQVSIINDEGLVFNETYLLSPNSSDYFLVNQTLTHTGNWMIEASSDSVQLKTYSFVVETNKIDADINISQLKNSETQTNNQILSNDIAVAGICTTSILSLAALIVSIISFRRSTKIKSEEKK